LALAKAGLFLEVKTMESLVAYLLTAMLSWVPPYEHAPREAAADTRERYASIARDVAEVAMEGDEEPLFGGKNGRIQTAVLMLAIASYESSFTKSVDEGSGLGDNGHSYCLMQIYVGKGVTAEGWTGQDLVQDRKRCFRAGLHMLRRSFGVCHNLQLDDRISAYATGHCLPNMRLSRSRMYRARSYWESHAPPPALPEES
jgi:hypothetical protein